MAIYIVILSRRQVSLVIWPESKSIMAGLVVLDFKSRTGYRGFAVLQCSSKSCFHAIFTINKTYF